MFHLRKKNVFNLKNSVLDETDIIIFKINK